jgi:large subunit ribosomal protein L23
MAFLDRFKSKKGKGASGPKLKVSVKTAKVVEEKAATSVKAAAPAGRQAPPKDTTAYRVLVRPLVSEKTSRLEKGRQFTFVVMRSANKVEIKKAVEKHYRVHVVSVNIVNVLGKNIRSGRFNGRRSDWRKAYVTVAPGESIVF